VSVRAEQKSELLAAVRSRPGQTAVQLAPAVTVPQSAAPAGMAALFDLPAETAPLMLVTALLRELEREGWLSSQPWPDGIRWYPAPGPEEQP
jgi:hypothetical protein